MKSKRIPLVSGVTVAVAAAIAWLRHDCGRARFLRAAMVIWLAAGALAPTALAAVRIEPIAAYNLVADSNVESPSTYAPRAVYFAAKFCNDDAMEITNVFACSGDFTDRAPGVSPQRALLPLADFPLDGKSALTYESSVAGTTAATRSGGTNPCRRVYRVPPLSLSLPSL